MRKQILVLPVAVSFLAGAMSAAMAADKVQSLAMMDMMPMAGGAPAGGSMPGMAAAPAARTAAPVAAPPMSGGMGDDKMPMGGPMPTQGRAQAPASQAGAPMQPMAGCGMMQGMMPQGGTSMQGMAPQPGMAMQGAAAPSVATSVDAKELSGSSAARLEGRIAFLRAELKISGSTTQVWETFATSLRAGREHLDAARTALQDSGTAAEPMARLEAYETHLKARTEAIHATRMAFGTLYVQLDDGQKRVATATMLPFIGAF